MINYTTPITVDYYHNHNHNHNLNDSSSSLSLLGVSLTLELVPAWLDHSVPCKP